MASAATFPCGCLHYAILPAERCDEHLEWWCHGGRERPRLDHDDDDPYCPPCRQARKWVPDQIGTVAR